MNLKEYIREIIENELSEDRISTMVTIGDNVELIEKAKEFHNGHWFKDLISFIEETGETGITANNLSKKLEKDSSIVRNKIKDFTQSGVLKEKGLETPKKIKTPSERGKGRPPSNPSSTSTLPQDDTISEQFLLMRILADIKK